MLNKNKMETTEKILQFLGFRDKDESLILKTPNGTNLARELPNGGWDITLDRDNPNYIPLDFLHDRNQQKWIIDKLKKRGWRIITIIDKNYACVDFIKWYGTLAERDYEKISKENKISDLNLAFIQAVEQLIDKENEIK
jgi:hypothetical protein